MNGRFVLLLVCAGVLLAGRNVVRQWTVLADATQRREFDVAVAESIERVAAELPRDAVIRFRGGADHPELFPQLRFQLAPRRVVFDGSANFEVLPVDEAAEDRIVGPIAEGFLVCRTIRD